MCKLQSQCHGRKGEANYSEPKLGRNITKSNAASLFLFLSYGLVADRRNSSILIDVLGQPSQHSATYGAPEKWRAIAGDPWQLRFVSTSCHRFSLLLFNAARAFTYSLVIRSGMVRSTCPDF